MVPAAVQPDLGKLGSGNAAFGRATGMERLGHRAEIFAAGPRIGCRPKTSARCVVSTSSFISLALACGGGEGAAGRRGMETGLVVARIDRLGDLAL